MSNSMILEEFRRNRSEVIGCVDTSAAASLTIIKKKQKSEKPLAGLPHQSVVLCYELHGAEPAGFLRQIWLGR